MNELDFVHPDDVLYLWLPSATSFGRALLGAQLSLGFRAIVDGRGTASLDGLANTHPTILVGVPRIFEKVRSAVLTMNAQKGLKGRISRWAFLVGRDSRAYRLAGRPLPRALALQYRLADRLVFSKLKDRLGGRMRFMISGSAKLSHQVQEWFYSAGIIVVEGYGATETAAISFLNLPDRPRFGTVGPLIPGWRRSRRRRRGADQGPHRGPWLPQPAPGDRRGIRGRLVPHRRYRHLGRDGYDHPPPQEGLFKTSSSKFVAPAEGRNRDGQHPLCQPSRCGR